MHPPAGEIGQWRLPDRLGEAPGERRPRQMHLLRERLERPTLGRPLVEESDSAVVGMKKNGMAKPRTTWGSAMSQNVASVVKKLRQMATPAIQKTPNETSARMSNRPTSLATMGDMNTASTPFRQPA